MKARWAKICPKCDTRIEVGDDIKAQYRRAGINTETGKPIWERVPKSYVHAPKCPKVTKNTPGRRIVDPRTGEIIEADLSSIPRHTQEQLLP